VRRYRRRGAADDDLRQVCLLALVHATERFDPSLGVGFPTFASRTIDGEVKRHLRDRTWAVRPPRRIQELFLEVRRAEDELAQELQRPPTVHDIAERLGESSDRVLEALEAGGAHQAVSIDAPHRGPDNDGEGRASTLGEPEPAYDQIDRSEVVTALLDRLSARDRDIIEMRFFANMSQPAIAERVGVSQSYLSRVLRSILLDLRRGLGPEA
jgi:RNA polymerase sigma-B factor